MLDNRIKLSSTEEEILRAFGYGLNRNEIAEELDLPKEQLDRYVAGAYEKLHLLEQLLSLNAQSTSIRIPTL